MSNPRQVTMDDSYGGSPLRFNMIRYKKKPLIKWIKELGGIIPRFSRSYESEKYEWVGPCIPSRWEMVAGPMLLAGDPGYGDARFEVGFISTPASMERMKRDETDTRQH